MHLAPPPYGICRVKRDFSLTIYKELIAEIKNSGWPVFTVRKFIEQRGKAPPAFVILRHDVDRRPGNALRMAQMERSSDICSTYYFRTVPGTFDKDVILQVADLGHEVGYHYEVMDRARGKLSLAERILEEDLRKLRALADVRTAAMHGNPLSRQDNREFWKYHPFSRYGLLGEAYLSLKNDELFYATDTGRGWNRARFNVHDGFRGEGLVKLLPPVSGTRGLMRVIRRGEHRKLYLLIHPNRWSWNTLQWRRQWVEDLLLNGIKVLARGLASYQVKE